MLLPKRKPKKKQRTPHTFSYAGPGKHLDKRVYLNIALRAKIFGATREDQLEQYTKQTKRWLAFEIAVCF